ncbi:hypothetical protein IRZ81_14280 [Pseudomonas putida]|jgi:hypothetical protein|uniref:hypothetical protein n=1 Tax=Pseudomonas TaxID=286 RepID=UPI001304D176|nr:MULTISPECIES: hypothetical protein [Pseudomonas]MBF8651963.1 hypothetical protein [Pseudomonas putida]MBF8655915.1 hypothetical protein [Pseudomonas putida]
MSGIIILAVLALAWYVVWVIDPRHTRGIVLAFGSIIFIGQLLSLNKTDKASTSFRQPQHPHPGVLPTTIRPGSSLSHSSADRK